MRRYKLFLSFTFLLTTTQVFAQEDKLISFNVEDQFGKEYTERSWQDSILVVFGSDKDGSKYNERWAVALYENYQSENLKIPVTYIGVADLSSVPFFLKSTVRKFIKNSSENGIILDWEGVFPEAYNFVENNCNILMFDFNRNLIYQTAVQNLETEKITEIVNKLKNVKS